MNFTFLNMMQGSPFIVHRTGCSDIRQDVRMANSAGWTAEAESVDAAVAAEVEEFRQEEMGYEADSFDVKPCCRRAA